MRKFRVMVIVKQRTDQPLLHKISTYDGYVEAPSKLDIMDNIENFYKLLSINPEMVESLQIDEIIRDERGDLY